jgi:hypothetical protein
VLPQITELEFEDALQEQEELPQVGRSFLFDFKTGEFVLKDGKFIEVSEIEALKVWIENTIRTERYQFRVYQGTEYGVTISDLIGSHYSEDFIEAELIRELSQAISEHPLIDDVSNWEFERDGSYLKASFQVNIGEYAYPQEVMLNGA